MIFVWGKDHRCTLRRYFWLLGRGWHRLRNPDYSYEVSQKQGQEERDGCGIPKVESTELEIGDKGEEMSQGDIKPQLWVSDGIISSYKHLCSYQSIKQEEDLEQIIRIMHFGVFGLIKRNPFSQSSY